MNPRLGHPNLARAPNTLVNIGVIFYTRGGERLHDLALKFYTSVSQLLQDNADLVCTYDSCMRACISFRRRVLTYATSFVLPSFSLSDSPTHTGSSLWRG